jgi:hypothetical protein
MGGEIEQQQSRNHRENTNTSQADGMPSSGGKVRFFAVARRPQTPLLMKMNNGAAFNLRLREYLPKREAASMARTGWAL